MLASIKKLSREVIDLSNSSNDKKTIALAGNPNVGKSTLFNALTGLKQHTGNWPGKTVGIAQGEFSYENIDYTLVDLPGTYSLMAHSAEEEVARDFICFEKNDAVLIICDATCLERNLNLVLQTMEITKNVIVCVNLLDEARKKHIKVDLPKLQELLNVPVVGITARSKKGVDLLLKSLSLLNKNATTPNLPRYLPAIEKALAIVETALTPLIGASLIPRFVALRLLEDRNSQSSLNLSMSKLIGFDITKNEEIITALDVAWGILSDENITKERLKDNIVSCLVLNAEGICCEAVCCESCRAIERDRKLDKILTGKLTGIPIMLILLCIILWITMVGANYPSSLLATGLFWVQDRLTEFFTYINAPAWMNSVLVLGVYRVLAWVVSVMLPPMAIFFPLFTLLEDFGYLPRVAFNLDHSFQKAKTCGKQALTLCMGFGCNAAGVVGCRIIDSPRERIIAAVTNCFVPCNGRFPTLIAIITMFFAGSLGVIGSSVVSSLMLTAVIFFGIILTFIISRILSATLLKGEPSSFALELPPYRKPQIGKVLLRSLIDRTLRVLGRAVIIAAPSGLVIWGMANISVDGATLLAHCSAFLDPFARLLGLDGVILLGFILGFPANEIVVPIILMAYTASGSLLDISNLSTLKAVLVDNGWTWITAISMMLFCLCHWPCSTTCMSIKKETGSFKWTIISFLLPTIVGMTLCFGFNMIVRIINLI